MGTSFSTRAAALLFSVLLFTGCEQVFTANVFSSFTRDPSKLPFDQQVAYAESALSSGDAATMADAYDALAASLAKNNNTDADLNLLASNLAVGASGLTDQLPDLVQAAMDGNFATQADLATAVDAVIPTIDYSYISAAQSQLADAKTNGGTITEDQYLMVAVGMVLQTADTAGTSINDITSSDDVAVKTFVNDAVADLTARGETSDLLTDLQGMLP